MNFAIIGASGNVGRKTIEILEKSRIPFKELYLVASKKSAGKKINFRNKEIIIESLESYDFKALAKKEKDKRIYQRLMMLAYLKEGMSKAQVSRLTFTAPDRVYAWLKRFREQGIEGLRDKPRSGRPGLLDRSAYDALQQKIKDSQSLLSGGRLRGEDIIQLVKDEWGVEYTLSGIYRLMKAIGMSWVSTRSKHPEQDEQAQQQFKKTLPP